MAKSTKLTEQKQLMLDQWSSSGQSIVAFCKEQNIAYHSFFYWQKKLSKTESSSKGKFLKLPSSSKSLQSPGAEVIYPNGTRIVFHSLPEVFLLKQLAE